MKQIIIGRHGTQPFPISDDTVSGNHAVFTFNEATGQMTIRDNNSTNGTFISRGGGPFTRIGTVDEYIDANTRLRFGPNLVVRAGQLVGAAGGGGQRIAPPPKQEPKRVDITYLRHVAREYEEEKIRLETKQASLGSLKSLSILGSMSSAAVGAIITTVFPDYKILSIVVSVVITITLIAIWYHCDKESKKLPSLKNNNDRNYRVRYCCPNCHLPFAGKFYENLIAEGKCSRCKAEFYESSTY